MAELDPQPVDAFNMLSLDPGTETLGHAIIQVHCESLEIVNAEAWTVHASKLPYLSEWNASLYHDRFARIQALKQSLLKTLEIYNPSIVACESPFYNPRRPNAFEALLDVLFAIRETVFQWNPNISIAFITPSLAKKSIGVSGQSGDKDLVIKTILAHEKFKYLQLDGIDQHSADAMAVGYCRYTQIQKPPQSPT
jgi:Holliday junction resolvasome RuvABC endonuclease subunit